MKIFLILSFINLNAFGALSYGDASDGDCTWNVTQTLAKNIWNCNSITIGGAATIDFAGSSVVELRAQGTVTILGTIDISASGTTPGPGGGAPGTCAAAAFCSNEDGAGSTTGEGSGGTSTTPGPGGGAPGTCAAAAFCSNEDGAGSTTGEGSGGTS
ncbi:MAG: hypothetical protein KC478_14895, partial [Bacteriovoracaceae bacterium]|nr:hypothetical protein [Bacteriovoracaceae bacterium]